MRLRYTSSALAEVTRPREPASVAFDDLLSTLGLTDEAAMRGQADVLPADPAEGEARPVGGSQVAMIDPELRLLDPQRPAPASTAMAFIRRRANSQFAARLRQIVAGITGSRSARTFTHCVVMASVGARADTSLVAAALAVTCATTGYRVLLVDANLARPRLHALFGVSNQVGLSDLLGGVDPPNFLAQTTSIPNLALIAAGSRVFDHASLLSRQRVRHRLDSIARAFDYMIIDGSSLPPALLARLAADSEQVIVAVKRHRSSLNDLDSALRVLREEGIDNSSVLILE